MGGCDDRDCQNKLNEVYTTVYGHGDNDGLCGCIKFLKNEISKKISVPVFMIVLTIIAIPIVAYAWNATTDHESRITILETKIEILDQIKEDTAEILKRTPE